MLLETVLALAILAIAGTSTAWLATDTLQSLSRAREQEAHVESAGRLLEAVSVWPRTDLDRRLGITVQGPFRMDIQRETVSLYHITILDSLASRVVLSTSLHRPERVE